MAAGVDVNARIIIERRLSTLEEKVSTMENNTDKRLDRLFKLGLVLLATVVSGVTAIMLKGTLA